MSRFVDWFSSRTPGHHRAEETTYDDRVIGGRVKKHVSPLKEKQRKEKSLEEIAKKEQEDQVGGDESIIGSIEEDDSFDDEEDEKADELIDSPKDFGGIAMRAARARDSTSEDRTPAASEASSTTQETNLDYDPEEGWRYEQVCLNQILKARDEYTLMPSTWRMHFRGIPLPEGLFYVQTQSLSVRPRIYSHTDRFEYRGAIALRRLMDVHGQIRDIRKAQTPATKFRDERRTASYIIRRLREALRWAELDGDLVRYGNVFPANVLVMDKVDAEKETMHMTIQEEMRTQAIAWRDALDRGGEEGRPIAPIIFGFVIFKHTLTIVTLDAENPEAACHVPCQLNMSELNQHQWNALAIMVTVCWARDLFAGVTSKIPDIAVDAPLADSDPDA